jgi:hypothetical protein
VRRAAVALAALFLACSSGGEKVNRGVQDAQAAQAELKKEFGVDLSVSYRYSGEGGKTLDVQVRFAQPPPADSAQVQEKAAGIVRKNFRDPTASVKIVP